MTARCGLPVQIDPMLFHFVLSARCHLANLRNFSTVDNVPPSVNTLMLELYPLLRPQPQRYITCDLDLGKILGILVDFCQGRFYY